MSLRFTPRWISRRLVCLIGIGSLVVIASTYLSRAAASRRAFSPESVNVLLISVDTLRADRLNCYGYQRRRTSPAMDALARDGVLFETHITASPWTIPSHHSLLTSLLPSHHGVVASFAEFLYARSGKGEFHRLADEHVTLAEALSATGRETAAFTGGATLDPRLGFNQGFGRYDTSMLKMSPRRLRALAQWIDAQGQRCFFVFWHTFEVHAPYLTTDFLHEVLQPESTRELRTKLGHIAHNLDAMGIADSASAVERALRKRGVFNLDVCSALYDGGVLSFDRHFGELVSFLRERGLYDRTLVVLTSDHGEELGGHSRSFYNCHGLSLYDEMVRVPLIIKLPKQAHAGARIASVASSIDVMPTILDVVNARHVPSGMEGSSLRPLWEGGAARAARPAISEVLWKGPEKKSIRSKQEKLVLTIDESYVAEHGRIQLPQSVAGRELYDLAADPGERINILNVASQADAAQARAGALERTLRSSLGARIGRPGITILDDETLRQLHELNYLE